MDKDKRPNFFYQMDIDNTSCSALAESHFLVRPQFGQRLQNESVMGGGGYLNSLLIHASFNLNNST